tara:strand:+ start:191 stop:352 length:162 start_codon:yes stop_codon:yes gene_type:complete
MDTGTTVIIMEIADKEITLTVVVIVKTQFQHVVRLVGMLLMASSNPVGILVKG